jgi:hypothetical protein
LLSSFPPLPFFIFILPCSISYSSSLSSFSSSIPHFLLPYFISSYISLPSYFSPLLPLFIFLSPTPTSISYSSPLSSFLLFLLPYFISSSFSMPYSCPIILDC